MARESRRSALFLSPEAPYPATGGGSLRSASLLEYLGSRYDVDAVLFRDPAAPDPRPAIPAGLLRGSDVIDLPFHSRRAPARAARNAVRYLAGRAPLNDRFGGCASALGRILDGRRYDLAVIEHFWCAPYCEQLAPRAARVLLDLHNIESVYYERSAAVDRWPVSAMMRRFARAARALESRWLPRFASVLVASSEDAAQIRHICPNAAIDVYPNSIPLVPAPACAPRHAVVFSGNFEYAPNISAVRFFRHLVWPRLRAQFPELVWRLVGKNPHAIAKLIAGDDRIDATGPVENAIEELAAAEVAIVPLLAGSGTRIKILEAWAAARPVVSTSLGAEGLDARSGEHLLLADSPGDFAAAVIRLLQSPEERARLAAAGRRYYERRFTYQQAWQILATIGV